MKQAMVALVLAVSAARMAGAFELQPGTPVAWNE